MPNSLSSTSQSGPLVRLLTYANSADPPGAQRAAAGEGAAVSRRAQVIDRALGGLERSDSGKPLNLGQSTETFLVTIADVVSSADRSSMHSLHGPLIAKIVCTFRVCEAPTSKLLSGPRSTSRYCRVARVAHTTRSRSDG